MATLAQGQAVKLHCAISQEITVTPSTGGRATISANGPGNVSYAQKTISAAETFGPYLSDTDVVIAAVAGSLSYDLGAASVVDAGGNVVSTLATDAIQSKVIPQLTPTDWYPDAMHASDGNFLYGAYSASNDTLVRYQVGSHAATVGAQCAAGKAITYIATTSTPGLIFIHVDSGSGSGDIYRSTDYGATASLVLQLGSRNQSAPVSGSRSANVRWLADRSFCEATVNGAKVLLIGEYNAGTSRTIGGANDAVCLYRSTDAGLTWAIVAEWNTDGNTSYNDAANGGNYVRHIHGVRYSPVDGKIYILFGDVGTVGGVASNAQAGFVQWDGVTPITSNVLISSYNLAGLKSISGLQQSRATDMLFESDGIYVLTDAISNTSSSEFASGVFRFSYDLTTRERIDKSILEVSNRSGRLGVRHPNGNQIWLDAIEGGNTTAGAYFTSLYTSSSDRSFYARNAVCRSKTGGVSFDPRALFIAGSNIYVTHTQGSGIGKDGTTVLQLDATLPWNGERPDTVHPVYFVNTTSGTDDGTTTGRILRGNGPGTDAFKTLNYAMTSSRMPHGARCVLAAGTYSESTSINPVFLTTLADTTEYVNVSGAGQELTIVGNSQAASNWLFGPVSGSVQQNWDFQDMRLTTFKSGVAQTIFLYTSYANTAAYYLRLIRAEAGKRRGDISATVATDDAYTHIVINIAHTSVAARPNIRLVDSALVFKNAADLSNSAVLLYHNNAAGLPVLNFSAERSAFWGGNIQHGGAASTMKLVNCVLGGCTNSNGQIQIMSSATVSPFGSGNRFESQAVTKQIVNSSAASPQRVSSRIRPAIKCWTRQRSLMRGVRRFRRVAGSSRPTRMITRSCRSGNPIPCRYT